MARRRRREETTLEQAHLLIGDDDPGIRETMAEILTDLGHRVDVVADGDALLGQVRARSYDMVLCDVQFPPTNGITLLREIKRLQPKTLVVIFTGHATVTTCSPPSAAGRSTCSRSPSGRAARSSWPASRRGPRDGRASASSLAEELESERLRGDASCASRSPADDPFQRHRRRARSRCAACVDTLREVARTDCTVLLTGESGTGKGSWHARSTKASCAAPTDRSSRPTASSTPEGVLHSELFGHERGAFTGADAREARALRAGARRHAVPRRDRRHLAGDAAPAAARAAGAHVRAGGRRGDPARPTCG